MKADSTKKSRRKPARPASSLAEIGKNVEQQNALLLLELKHARKQIAQPGVGRAIPGEAAAFLTT